MLDARGQVEAFNRGGERLFGYPESEVVGRNVSMLMPSPDHEQHDGYLARYLETGAAPLTARLVTALVIALALTAAPGCRRECTSPTAPCRGAVDLTGEWSGSSTYINAPFTMNLRHTGTSVTGQYRDQKDVGSVTGTASGSTIVLDVNFGDTGVRFTGSVESHNRLTGEIFVPALGGRRFPFEMVR